MTHYWRILKWRGDRFGEQCRLIAAGRNGNVLVEFADGEQIVTSRFSIRRLSVRER